MHNKFGFPLYRGFAVGIYATNSAEACLYNLESSSANIVVVENDVQLQKILKIKDRASTLKAIIQYSGTPNDPSVYSVRSILKLLTILGIRS